MAESDSGSITPTSGNYIACESITNKLTDVAKVAESLDTILKDLQNCLDLEEPCSSSEEKKSDRVSNRNDGSSADEWNSSLRSTEDESFVTASDFRFTPQSTRSSYRTASEGGSPWWNNDKTSLDTSGSDMDPEVPSMQLLTGVVSSASVSFDDSEHSFLSALRSPLHSEQTDSDELTTNKTKSSRSSLLKSPATSSQTYRDFNNASTSSKSGDTYHIKVVEIDPKLTFLGSNIEEAVLLQKQHDEVFKQLQNKNSPIDEFVPKAEKLLQQNQARPEVLDAMGQSLSLAWNDVLKLLQQKKHILDLNVNFHEKLGICKGKMSALEVACRDTMIPIEIESVQEFLNKFKQLRIEVLASVMVALKEGNELLANLRELAHTGTVDSRPDHIKYEVKKSIHQVEKWLEELHDRRNILESAWQTRKIQLEQCLALAIFAKELGDLETVLKNRRNELSSMPNLGDSESSAIHLLQDYIALKQDAVSLRDKALKITRATEKLVTTGCFAGDEACSKAYSVLNGCVEYLDSIEQIEGLLIQSKEFFAKAEKALSVLEKLEIEVSTSKHADGSSEAINIHAKVLDEIVGLTEEPLRLGYAILAEIGRSNADVSGIERVIEEIENRKIYLEEICTINSEHSIKVSESLNEFLEKHNKILSWLVSIAEASLRKSNIMGTSLPECNDFLKVHHQLLSDLEARGNEINNQLLTVTQILNEIEDDQRKDIDQKVDAIHTHWIELKNIVENRVDLVSILIQFLKLADSLSNMFNYLENVLKSVPEEEKMNQLNNIWSKVQPAYAQLKSEGERFIDETSKVADPYLETKSACRRVEEILNDFRGRQFNITESWESWTTRLVEQRETELLYETIMTENTNKINAATKLDAQLYPVLTTPSDEPATIKQFVCDKLSGVLSEITKASNEIDNRIHTTSTLQPKDDETRDKVKQVIRNLYGIKDKLSAISSNYRMLLESLISFLGNIVNTQTEIETYFRNKSQQSVNQDGNVDAVLSDHERFKDRIMQQFRELIAESERIIDIVRDQEPDGAKEHDADRIIRLLEQLRVVFEMQSDGRSSELTEKKKQSVILKFNKELNEIHQNLDDITKQLNDTQGQYGETTASARTIALGFEYFERTIQLMEKRIDNFIHTSENISKTYPDIGRFVDDEVQKLKQRWDDIRTRTQNTRRTIDLANEYFELADGIEQTYRDHNNNLQNITNQIIHIKTYNEAKSLTTTIDNYITNNEAQQLDRLKSLSNLSNKIYGFDKTVPMYTDNISLFQSFFKLKSDLSTLADQFKAEEAAKQQVSKDEVDKRAEQLQVNRQEMVVLNETKFEHPVFTQPLCDATIQEGDRIILQCVAKGYPEPSIEWFKDQLSIQHNPDYHRKYENGLCTLSIEETFAEDSARFSCKASNCVGATETTCMLTVKEAQIEQMLVPPNFVKFLENGFAKEGGSFEFRCTVTGNPLPTVQWYKNDACVDNVKDYCISYNNGEAVLRFEEVFLDDQAVFTCKATNMVGTAQCSAGLSVQSLQPSEMPVFRVPLTNIMARVGQKIKLECEITGTPRPQIFWSHNGKPFSGRDFKSQYDNERATLVIPEAFPKDAGVYIVTAKNLAGEAYSSCNVSVKGRLPNETSDSELASDMEPVKPSVQLPLKDISVFEGKPVRLDCVIVAQPEPEVIWYHNNRPVKESVDVQLVFQGDRCSLIIQEAYLEDGGDYRVVAINSAGEASSNCTLSITPLNELEPATRSQSERILPSEMPPKFERLLSDILADEGEVIEFECSLVGDPKPLIKWYLNNKEIFESDRIKFKQSEDGTVKLIIHNVTNLDKGVYTVKASNSCGDAKCFSHLIVKSVNAPESLNIQIQQPEIESHLVCPTFKELFKDQMVQIDEPAKFECIVVGKPTPKIKWFFNDQPVAGKNFLVSTSGERQVLTIPKVLSETVGKISCVAENDVGKATCVAYLSLQGDFNAPSSQQSQRYIEEHNTGSSNVTIRKQMFTTTHTSQINTFDNANGIPQTQIHAFSSKLDQSVKKLGDQSPEVLESKQFQEYRQINDLPPQMQQRSIVNFIKPTNNDTVPELPKIVRKNMSPRFVTPLVGKIVDQGSDVMLEAIVDGYPVPDLVVTKNGEPLIPSANVSIVHKLNKINIELRNVGVEDAGRYSCTASNPAGTSTSTADVVVKKSIFPPVFGHRLQAQVAKRGERIRMDVEVSGTPSPTVTWFKDNQPLSNKGVSHSIKQSGNNHTLIIEAANIHDAGKYMVRAVNAGGEAQSIADFAVMEPTPERMVEVVKTVVFDSTNDKKEAGIPVTTNLPSSFHSSQHQLSDLNTHAATEQTIITETTHTTEATMRMEHKTAHPDILTTHTQNSQIDHGPVKTQSVFADACLKSLDSHTNEQPIQISKIITEEKSIDSSSIPKSAAYNFFANKMKADETMAPIPEEKYTKFEELNKPVLIMPDTVDGTVHTIPMTLNNELTAGLNLVPGTPPEIGFMPKLDEAKHERVTDQIKKLEESHNAVKFVPEIKRNETFTKEFIQTTHAVTEPIIRPQAHHVNDEQSGAFRCASPRPSADGVAMDKLWSTPKVLHPERHFDTSNYHTSKNEFAEEKSSYKKFAMISESNGEQNDQNEPVNTERKTSTKETAKMFEEKIKEMENSPRHDYDLKAPGMVQQIIPRPQPERPKSVQECILPDIYLEPGSPPEICYAPRTERKTLERKHSLVETIEQVVQQEGPSKVLPGSVRMVPPPPKKEKLNQEVFPSRPSKPEIPSKDTGFPISQSILPELEAFPFTPEPEKPKPEKLPPPPTPSKFVRVTFADSDYSDTDTKISSKWNSESEECKYAPVQPPTATNQRSQQQQNPAVPSPCQFEIPKQMNGDTRPLVQPVQCDTVKHKPKVVSGYMADTEEVYHKMTSSEHKYESSNSVHHSKQMFEALSNQQKSTYSNTNQTQTTSTPAPPTKHYRHYVQKHDTKDETSGQYEKNFTTSSLIQKNISMNSKSIKFHEEPRLEPLPFVPEPSRPVVQSVRVPPPPSPSKFVKGEFKESDYESDYERKGPAVWRPSNDSDSEPMYYKPIRPILTPTGRQSKLSDGKSPIPPTEFENPPQFEGPPRPKFEPIDKPKTNFVRAEPATKPVAQQQLFKPKPVAARPVQQPTYQQQPNQYPKQPCRYYTAVAGPPQHIAAETSNTMHMSESTESSHRVVNMSQTKRIIQFDARKSEFDQKLEPFPFSPDQPSYTQRPNRLPPPPTPTKFVPAEFRESDYESEVEAARIRPVWTPNPSDSDEPQYRRVSAPQQYRSASVPRSYGHGRVLTPMEFDTKPIEMPRKIVIETSGPRTINKTQTLDRYSSKKSHFAQSSSSTRDDIELKPSSPPKYGFIPGQMVNQAEQHMYDMNSTFKTKAQQFVSDVVRDTQTPNIRPILKKDGNEGDKPQIYREDSRVSQYGTKHIDPNTGLIYFKYDFGYEFGIIFPGQGKKIIGGTRHITHDTSLNNSEPFHASASDINIPVVHERTAAGNSNNGCSPSNEYLFTNDPKRKRLSLPAQIDVDNLTRSTPDRITPNFKREQSWNGRATTPIVNYGSNQDQVPKRAPMFITPLKDIAVVNGNSARFECIVQCEPYPNISWSRNGVPLNQSPKHVIEFRNGVCRLTIPQAFTGDAGTYTCTGSNNIGTVATTAELLIPSDQWGSRK